MNDEQFRFINEEVKAKLQQGNTSFLLDYIGSEFEYLQNEISELGPVIYKDSFSQIEQVIENAGKLLTSTEEEQITSIVFTATFQHNMYFNCLKNELNETRIK